MRAPEFWWREPGLASTLLFPIAWLYGLIAASRMRKAGTSAKVPVICVGNPTVGGAGKTPTALTIASMLSEMGEKPFFLTRGYGGNERGPLLVEIGKHSAREVGDEPLLLASKFPTIVLRDRGKAAEIARDYHASVIVMDDGFQNPSLSKNLSLLVIDGGRGLGNGHVFPAGPLRAPLQEQYARAQALVLVGGENSSKSFIDGGLPVFTAKLEASDTSRLQGKKLLAYAGIGNPDKFFSTLRGIGAEVADTRAFADHHFYTAADARALLDAAAKRSLTLVTTEKDLARMSGNPELDELASASVTLPVKLKFSDSEAMKSLLKRALESARTKISA